MLCLHQEGKKGREVEGVCSGFLNDGRCNSILESGNEGFGTKIWGGSRKGGGGRGGPNVVKAKKMLGFRFGLEGILMTKLKGRSLKRGMFLIAGIIQVGEGWSLRSGCGRGRISSG
ncbi:hypothetical protein CEXT_355671 [Caerostris extrusa]|uniref:Uncharacterized protein n=1 Tax=Caerostris extrusa TaxID=172846 RepID=A0AAV4U7X9_CAEEX|nr:hypothetical protein CEXT_355671 [Caerostris extrusa]